MSTIPTTGDSPTLAGQPLTRDATRDLLGQVMGLVALTVGCTALGAYVGRDLGGGAGILFFVGAFACIFGLNVAASRGNEQLAVGLLFGLGLLLGLAVAPVLDDYSKADPAALWQAAGATALFVAGCGAYIDLYQIQRPDPETDIEETLSALSGLIHSGKVRAIGSSMMPASDLVEAHWVAERRGLERFHTEQPAYSLLNRGIEREVLPTAQRYGMGILAWGPLGQGMLTGRVRKGQQTDVVRASFFKAFSDEHRLDTVEQLIPLAEESRPPDDPPRDGLRHHPPRRHVRTHRTAHDDPSRRPARRHERHAQRRHPRPRRRGRPARHGHRHARPGVRPGDHRTPESSPPTRRTPRRGLSTARLATGTRTARRALDGARTDIV